MMNPPLAAAVGATVSAASVVAAQSVINEQGAVEVFTIFSIGAAVVGFLVRRDAQSRKYEQDQRDLDIEHRRLVDVRREEELASCRAERLAEREANRHLYERFLQYVHQLDPTTPPPRGEIP